MESNRRSCRDGASWPRALVALVAVVVLVAAACGDDDDTGAPPATDPDGAETWSTCENPENGYRIEHPPDWETNEGDVMAPCSLFDPGPIDVAVGTEIPTDIAVAVTVEPPATESGGLGEDVRSEEEATVDGRTATRVEVEATGEGLYPEGMRTTRWIVPADGQRILARTHDRGELDYTEKQDVLDRMVETLVIDGAGTTTTTGGDESAEPVGEPDTQAVDSGDFPAGFDGDTAYLVDVRVVAREGFDRIVLEFDGDDPPSYRVEYVEPPIRAAGSGNQVDIDGDAYLEANLQPASGVDLRGEEFRETYDGPDRIPLAGGSAVREVVETGDYESHLTWVAGLDAEVPFGVTVLSEPLRLVIDIVPDQGA